MDRRPVEPFDFPLITVASLVVIVLAARWLHHVPISKGFASAAFGLVAFAGASAFVGWAVDDPQRLRVLLAMMVAVAMFAAFHVVRRRTQPRPPEAPRAQETKDPNMRHFL
jgi:hypothetical protein